MSSDGIFYIVGLIVGFIAGFILHWMIDDNTIKSPTPLSPTIEIRIQPDGTSDTTYVYTK